MGRFDIFPIFIATFASIRVTLIATHSKAQKQTRLPIRYLYFILSFKPLINKEVIKVFQNYDIIFYRTILIGQTIPHFGTTELTITGSNPTSCPVRNTGPRNFSYPRE